MIKPYFSLLMYSGLHNPQVTLNKEQEEKVIELCKQLDKPYDTPLHIWCDWIHDQVGQTCYMIYWYDPEANMFTEVYSADLMGLHVFPNGKVRLYRKQENYFGKLFEDTVGLWKYLNPIGENLNARHLRDVCEAMDDYNEKVLRIPR